jgi:hypothetical protein
VLHYKAQRNKIEIMMIQINTGKNLSVNNDYEQKINEAITKELKRFDERITRVEVHFSDENSSKEGLNDKKCLLEVRLKGMEPIVVTDFSNSYDLSLSGALVKMKSVLNSKIGKIQVH